MITLKIDPDRERAYNFCMMRETEVIEQVMSELEDCGTVRLTNKDGVYDMIKEVRSFMGEWDFYKFLEYSMQVWGFSQAKYFDDTEND